MLTKIVEIFEYSDCPCLILERLDLTKEEGCYCDIDNKPCAREKCKVVILMNYERGYEYARDTITNRR